MLASTRVPRRRILACCGTVTVAAIVTTLSGCAAMPKEPSLSPEQRQLNVAAFDDVWTTIRDTHWDPELGGLDWEALRDELRPRVAAA